MTVCRPARPSSSVVRGAEQPERTLHVDVRSHLVVRTEELRSVEGRTVDFVTEIGDYRSVNGLVYPHRIEVGPGGSPDRQRLVVRAVEVNPALEDARFAMPAAARPRGVAGTSAQPASVAAGGCVTLTPHGHRS